MEFKLFYIIDFYLTPRLITNKKKNLKTLIYYTDYIVTKCKKMSKIEKIVLNDIFL